MRRACRSYFAMFVLLRALFSPLRWLDATWLLRSCCRVESEWFFFFFNVRIPANVAQIKFKLEVNRRRGGGGEGPAGGGEDCFHFEIPPLHSAETNIPNLEATQAWLPRPPPLLSTRSKGRGRAIGRDATSWFSGGRGSP